MTAAPLLAVERLRLDLASGGKTFSAVDEVSFEIARGEAFGLVGESGCGKSITALSVMGLLRRPLSVAGGRIVLDDEEIRARLREDGRVRAAAHTWARTADETVAAYRALLARARR